MSACVLDTDAVIATLDRRDAHHSDASLPVSAMIDGRVELLISTVD
ncbi:MAG: hypothetical protein H0U12_13340 [Thermoleophilaceae bacterium]|nr:hypothetical protein [Thermoleophilaceae bacterium]